MINNFFTDLEKAKDAEKLVKDTFQRLAPNSSFIAVGDKKEYYHKGDVLCVYPDGKEICIEVKDDSVIATSGRVLCEDRVYFKEQDYYQKGNMYCDTDVYCIVSKSEKLIYVIDFKTLKQIYKQGEFKIIRHAQQDTHCYLLDLCRLKQQGALIAKINYEILEVIR